MKLSGNVAFPTMLQSVLGLGSQEGGEGVHSRGNFCPQHPLRMARSASLLKESGKEVRV